MGKIPLNRTTIIFYLQYFNLQRKGNVLPDINEIGGNRIYRIKMTKEAKNKYSYGLTNGGS
jgi:hypothetical protein